ncbi:DUF899 family protein [Streptomyces nodosus]|uniref:DUF899 family protein n=1 Tax=Streptomyces nodosus TaxID=40318 RepID=UPI0038135A0C
MSYHMWHDGHSAADQCEGCTFFTGQVRELSYLHQRDVAFAVFCQGSFEESDRYRRFMGWEMPWYSVPAESHERLLAGHHFGMKAAYLRDGDRVFETYWTTGRGVEPMAPSYGILDMTVHGRQETWEDSPPGCPQPYETRGQQGCQQVGGDGVDRHDREPAPYAGVVDHGVERCVVVEFDGDAPHRVTIGEIAQDQARPAADQILNAERALLIAGVHHDVAVDGQRGVRRGPPGQGADQGGLVLRIPDLDLGKAFLQCGQHVLTAFPADHEGSQQKLLIT